LPVPKMIGEMKTKPTQHAVRILNSIGIQPDMILARSAHPIDAPRKQKIAIFCNINEEDVVSAPDIESIYEIPINFEKDNLGKRVLAKFGLKRRQSNMREWRALVRRIKNIKKTVRIAVAGKYFATGNFMLSDSYISVLEAIKHAAWRSGFKPEIHWIDTEEYEKKPARVRELEKFDGIVVPGGFGKRGIEGKIKAIRYARTHNIPYLGLCYGMQLAVIEFSRNVGGMRKAHTTEIQSQTPHPVIATMPEQEVNLKNKDYGGSMRLGMYPCALKEGTTSFRAYKEKNIFERHRHRYEMNNDFRERLEEAGLVVAGTNPQRNLVEIIEIKNHPFFVGTQFHPELKSSPLKPHPLFREFLRVAVKKKK